MAMKLRCVNNHLIDPGPSSSRCVICGQSLRFAEEVYVSDSESNDVISEPVANDRISESLRRKKEKSAADGGSAHCVCDAPLLVEGTNECAACGLLSEVPDIDESAGREEDMKIRQPGRCVMQFPGGVEVEVGSGILIGKSMRTASPRVACLLDSFSGVSRLHAWLGIVDEEILITDLSSTNGTRVGDAALQPAVPFRAKLSSLPIEVRLGKYVVIQLTSGEKM